MPSDIRSFFGGKGGQSAAPAKPPPKEEAKGTKKRGSRKVVDDSSEDEVSEVKSKKKATPQKPRASKKEPQGEPTTSSDYFAANGKSKPSRSTPVKSKSTSEKPAANGTSVKSTPKTQKKDVSAPNSSSRKSSRKTAPKSYNEDDEDDVAELLKDEDDGDDDVFAADFAKNGKDDYMDLDEEVETQPAPKTQKAAASQTGKKRKSKELEDDDEDDFVVEEPKASKAKKSPAKPAAKKPKKEEKAESKEIQDIFNSIPTIRPPTPPQRDEETKKFKFAPGGGNQDAAPPAEGTKEIPVGQENCLAGLTFVFTGVLESLGREEGQSLVKRYGGKVTTGPSSKTSYVVLGAEAGPKKLETIHKLGLKTINEDGLFELIKRLPANGGDGKAAEKYEEKKQKDQERVQQMAAEIEKEERKAAQAKAAAAQAKAAALPSRPGSQITQSATSSAPAAQVDSRLWTDKYAPTQMSMICGNKGLVEKLQNWLRGWHKSAQSGFKKAGKDGLGSYRAAMLHGPPGIGKTTAAHLVAELEGFDVVESNASDTRSKKLVETGLKGVLDTNSLLGYFAGDGKKVEGSKKKLVLIMDEVDGMSAGDRGGVGALAAVAKKTNIPIIMICNERRQQKMRPFDHVTADFAFRRPTADQIRARLMTICYRENIKLPPQVLDALIEGSHADIRQIINMISTAKLDQSAMDYDQGKSMSKAWEKHVVLKPWDIVGKILRPQMFSESSTATLNDKVELYFNDHEFSYLMLQENYLKTTPAAAGRYQGRERALKLLELADNAAESISDGDLVDRIIHGSQQQWSLMPTHAVLSFVRPASFQYGNFTERAGFTTWLGMNSKQGKMNRYIKEIQGHMRLRASGDRHEVREQYLPVLWQKTVQTMQKEGKDKVDDVIDLMDSYFLTKEDYDAMVELGVGPMNEENVKVDSQTKATFTRLYNQRSHPLPFVKASSVTAPKKVGKVKPDLEDAMDESDDGEEILGEEEVQEDEDEDIDLKKDKYIKAPKKKAAPTAKKPGSKASKGKKKGAQDEDDDDTGFIDSEEDKKSKKSSKGRKGKGKA